MRTPRPKPNKLHDELDALLDGRPVELTDELAPLAEVAEALRAELAGYRLDPQVADRHLERVLDGAAPVVRLPVRQRLPVRHQAHGWDLRRRVAAVALAAALVLAPATMASAAALPGQAMYPFKLAIEELRIAAVQWSPGREAVERTRVADERTEEVQRLTELQIFNQLPPALKAMARAVIEAKAAVDEAQQKGEPVAKVRAKLNQVVAEGLDASQQAVQVAVRAARQQGVPLSLGTLRDITQAAASSRRVLEPAAEPPPASTPPTTIAAKPAQSTLSTTAATQPPGASVSPTPTPTTAAPTTTTPPTTTPTTQAPTTTTAPESTATSGSATGGTGGDDDQAGVDGQSADQAVPTTTAPPGP